VYARLVVVVRSESRPHTCAAAYVRVVRGPWSRCPRLLSHPPCAGTPHSRAASTTSCGSRNCGCTARGALTLLDLIACCRKAVARSVARRTLRGGTQRPRRRRALSCWPSSGGRRLRPTRRLPARPPLILDVAALRRPSKGCITWPCTAASLEQLVAHVVTGGLCLEVATKRCPQQRQRQAPRGTACAPAATCALRGCAEKIMGIGACIGAATQRCCGLQRLTTNVKWHPSPC
jgi:hypothetical protein